MSQKVEQFTKAFLRNDMPDVKPGDTIRVHQKIKDNGKEKIQVFEGLVLARRHGNGINSTITVRKVVSGVGVERIFPMHSPNIAKIEIVKQGKVRRAKLYYLRGAKGRKARLKKRSGKENLQVPETEAKPVEVEA